MSTYRILYRDPHSHETDGLELPADDRAAAAIVAHLIAADRPAEVWRDDRLLCRVKPTGADFLKLEAS